MKGDAVSVDSVREKYGRGFEEVDDVIKQLSEKMERKRPRVGRSHLLCGWKVQHQKPVERA